MIKLNDKLISRSDSRFSLLPPPPPSATTLFANRTSLPDSFLRLPLSPRLPNSRVSVQTRVGSPKPSAATSDGFVAESAPQLTEDMSFYDLLGIPETGTLLEIKQAYKQLALKYHPDVSPPDRVEEFTQRFLMVQEAYETLSDPNRRALYDRDMAMGLHFAFSARKRYKTDEEQMEGRGEWKSRWQSQLSELKRRSMYKDTTQNISWGAQMRRQRNESSS